MFRRVATIVILCGAGLVDGRVTAAADAQRDGWSALFDGSSLKGWNRVGDANWEIVDGAIQATRGPGFLVSAGVYADFQLTLEFWASDDANSGVFLRCSNPGTITAENSYEVNIFDRRPDPTYRTGAIVDVAKPSAVINTGGKWNTFDITAQGNRLRVTLNGTEVVNVTHAKHARGPIALQSNGGTVRFRKIMVRNL